MLFVESTRVSLLKIVFVFFLFVELNKEIKKILFVLRWKRKQFWRRRVFRLLVDINSSSSYVIITRAPSFCLRFFCLLIYFLSEFSCLDTPSDLMLFSKFDVTESTFLPLPKCLMFTSCTNHPYPQPFSRSLQ